MASPTTTSASSSTHGGSPTSYSSNVYAEGNLVVRLGDTFSCPVHGTQTVSSASSTVFTNGIATARDGDSISCGATLTDGATTVLTG